MMTVVAMSSACTSAAWRLRPRHEPGNLHHCGLLRASAHWLLGSGYVDDEGQGNPDPARYREKLAWRVWRRGEG